MWIGCVTHTNEPLVSHVTHQRAMSPWSMSHVTHPWAMSPWSMSHVTHQLAMLHTNEPCHTPMSHVTHQWAMSHTNEPCHTPMSSITVTNEYAPLSECFCEIKQFTTIHRLFESLGFFQKRALVLQGSLEELKKRSDHLKSPWVMTTPRHDTQFAGGTAYMSMF